MNALTWTELPDKSGVVMTERQGSFDDLVKRLRNVGTFPSKDSCPWVKLATFGDKRSPKNSLRTNENLTAVYGVELDYDGGVVSIEAARDSLEGHGIKAALYPSPSSTAEKPRWRVVAPLAEQHPPSARAALVARLNGALGGIGASESFTLSQGFFFGGTPTNDYRVLVTFEGSDEIGQCVDTMHELDFIAVGKTSKSEPKPPKGEPPGSTPTDSRYAEMMQAVLSGEAIHTNLRDLAASMIASGMHAGAVVKHLRAVMDASQAPHDERWQARRNEIPTLVSSATQKFAPIDPDEVDPETGEIHHKQRLTSVSVCDVLTNPAKPPQFVWEGYLPRGNVALMGAHGGVGKSTIALMLGVSAGLGNPLFGVDTERCKVLFVSLEDGADVVRHRLGQICQAWFIEPADLDGVLQIVDGTAYPELFAAETRGAGELTRTYDELHARVKAEGFGLVIVDNASDAFGGDEIQRRQVRAFMRALAQIARLTDCAVTLLAHVDKATSRARKAEGGEGYSGSTAWHNSARSRLFLTRAENGTLTLEHQKSNLGKLREPLSLVWPEGGLPMLAPTYSGLNERMQGRADDEQAEQLLKMIAEFESRGQFCSPAITSRNHVYAVLKSEPEFQRLKLGSDATKRIVNQCQRAGWLEPLDYRTPDRKPHHRWTLTKLGRDFAGLPAPTAPTAPTTEDGASQNMAQASAPTCANWRGGVGVESAHKDGAHTDVS